MPTLQEHHEGTKKLFSLLFRIQKIGLSKLTCQTFSPGEMAMMSVLNAYNGQLRKEVLPICELSQRLHTTQPAVTQLVNRLEAKGFVSRESDESDRRAVLVRTTALGTRTFKKEYEASLQMVDAIIERMGDERSQQLLELMEEFMICTKEAVETR